MWPFGSLRKTGVFFATLAMRIMLAQAGECLN